MLLFFILINLLAQNSLQNSLSVSPRIKGGDFAERGKYPYHVALLEGKYYRCGGSIISKTFVLTAAHCTVGKNLTEMRIRVGTIDLRRHEGQSVHAKEFIPHPQFNREAKDFDFSLIRLSKPLKLGSATVNKIELSTAPLNLPEGTVGLVTGFGLVSMEKKISPRLKYANVFVWTRDQCDPQKLRGVNDHMVCTGHPDGGINAGKGDSGGPLVVDKKLYGVVSWGFGYAHKHKPTIYAYVGAALDWIKQVADVLQS